MMKKYFSFLILFVFGTLLFAQDGIVFKFKQKNGDSSSYISTVNEDVYVNGYLSHRSEIVNRISSTITNVDDENVALVNATYDTTENSVRSRSGALRLKEETTKSNFYRKSNGELNISDNIYMPTVRNVPVFPDRKLKPGDTWTADGKEVQDVREVFNMSKALIFPFTANYTYVKDVTEDGKLLNVIELSYSSTYYVPRHEIYAGTTLYTSQVKSYQILYWDNEKGILDHYTEQFSILLEDIQRNQYLFTGTGEAKVTEYKSINNDTTVEKIKDTIDDMNLKNITVKKGEKGLTISIDNIQFLPDSPILLDSEKEKLNKLAEILNQYSNDLLITGHCAARGTVQERQELSEQRADSVAEYLLNIGVRDQMHIFTQGKGSNEPVATNATEEGRAKNRRVEITIMD